MTYLDTHALIWLNPDDEVSFPARARKAIENDDELLISPMVLLELENLYEIGRFHLSADGWMDKLGSVLGVRVCTLPFGMVMKRALEEKWTRDPFDRIIVAQARARNAALITEDEKIRRNYKLALW